MRSLPLALCFVLAATALHPEEPATGSWPGLRWLDARYLEQILSGQPGLMMETENGKKALVWARTVAILRRDIPGQDFPGRDGPWYLVWGPFDPSRWDVLVNGVVIDPRRFWIQYDGESRNLGMLFSFPEETRPDGTDRGNEPWNDSWNP